MSRDPESLARRLREAGCVWAEDEARLLLAEEWGDAELERRVARRVAGEALETVVGWTDFRGVRIRLEPGVFVPRPRSAFLVDVALDRTPHGALVADVCCGSGALGAALRSERPDVELVAADLDPVAVDLARENLSGVEVVCGDLMCALPVRWRGRLDVVLANVPYVPTPDLAFLPGEAREHEPRATLDGGEDGLDVLRRVSGQAAVWLRPGGAIVSEIAARQSARAEAAMRAGGLMPEIRFSDEWETTVVVGTRPV